jgi:predicted ATPase
MSDTAARETTASQAAVPRYVLTGAPGSGKTSTLRALQELGFAVVAEAATDVIGTELSGGADAPWLDDGFVDQIAGLQRQRQQRPDLEAQVKGTAQAQVHDRSTLCTLALARFLDRPVTPFLAAEVDRVMRERVFEREVFLIRPIGFVERTAARRISYEDSLVFEKLHEAVYREHGFEIIEVPPADIVSRAAMIADRIAALRFVAEVGR